MNTRKQKIWLISMLSLMVLLSAYYLFTDDLNQLDDQKLAQGEGTTAEDLGAAYDSQFTGGGEFLLSDEEILAEVESLQASAHLLDQFDSWQYTRDQQLKEKFDEIHGIVTDPAQPSESMAQAYEQLHQLEEQHHIIQSLEEQLMEEFANAIITPQDNGEYHVRIMAEHLEKSQAVSIIETVAEQLGISNRDVFVTVIN